MPRTYEYKDPRRLELIKGLEEAARKEDAGIWRVVAEELSCSGRNRREVNLWRINKCINKGETIVVPGKVLGSGTMDHKVGVAAFKFSGGAKKKIKEAGGKVMSIWELMESNPKGSKIRIIG